MNDKMYTFQRDHDGSGVSFDVRQMREAGGKFVIVGLVAFDSNGQQTAVKAADATFALDCFMNQCEPDASWGN